MKKLLSSVLVGLAFQSATAFAEFRFTSIEGNYVAWEVTGEIEGNHTLFIFSETPGVTRDTAGAQKWMRSLDAEQSAWLPQSPTGNWYFTVCDYNLHSDTCHSYAEEQSLIDESPPITINTVQTRYVSWHVDTEAAEHGILRMFSTQPDIVQDGTDVTQWYFASGEGDIWLPEQASGHYFRLCILSDDFRCDLYSEEVFVPDVAGQLPPGQNPAPQDPSEYDGNFQITGVWDGTIEYLFTPSENPQSPQQTVDLIYILEGDTPELGVNAPGTTVHGRAEYNAAVWLNGRYAQLCAFNFSSGSCLASTDVIDTYLPQLDSYPDRLSPMAVPMGTGERIPSPYDPATTVDRFPVSEAERDASLTALFPGTFEGNVSVEGFGRFYYECGVSHIGYDDPIVFFGQPGVSHLHMFLGNQLTNANTTTQSLLDTTLPSTCRGDRLNRSAYWVPTMYDSHGNIYVPDTSEFMFVNYSTQVDPADMQLFPEGFRMIAGNGMASSPQDIPASWSCSGSSEQYSGIPACVPGQTLVMQLTFPQCWDGVNVDSPNQQEHVAWPRYSETEGALVCPDSHPVVLPEIRFDFRFDVHPELVGEAGNTSDWYLSSDMYDTDAAQGGYSIHGDFMNAWDDIILQRIIDDCIKVDGQNCNNSQLPGDVELLQRVRGRQVLNALPQGQPQ